MPSADDMTRRVWGSVDGIREGKPVVGKRTHTGLKRLFRYGIVRFLGG